MKRLFDSMLGYFVPYYIKPECCIQAKNKMRKPHASIRPPEASAGFSPAAADDGLFSYEELSPGFGAEDAVGVETGALLE